MRNTKTKKRIDRELLSSLFPSFVGTHLLDDIIVFFVDTYIAVILGRLTDAIFIRDIDYLKSNLLLIVLCLVFKIFCEPLLFAFFSSRSVFGSSDFTRKLLFHYLHKPYEEISENQAGDIPSRIDNDIMDFVRQKLKQTADRILLPVFSLYLLFILGRYNLLYVLVALTATAVTYIAPIIARKRMAKYDADERIYSSTMNSVETELASSAYCLQSMKLEKQLMAKMEMLFTSFFHKTYLSKLRCGAVVDTISSICQIAAQIIIIIAGAFFLSVQKISYGEIATMLTLVSSMTFLLDKVSGLITVKPILKNLYERLFFFYTETECDLAETKTDVFDDGVNLVEGQNVTAQYGDNTIFKDFSFYIPQNKITLLKGANGCGKSTLVGMLCGFEQPVSGKIIRKNESNNRFISLSSQNSVLFRYTGLRENILLGCYERETPEQADVLMEAFSLDNMENITSIENLSGGESQKAKLLRALLKDAELLILDEPENHLDTDTVHQLVKEIKREKKSILIVSHSNMFDEIADHVIAM